MGDDWCRMRPRSDVDIDRLKHIIDAAAQSYQRNGRGFLDDLKPFLKETDSEDAAWSQYQVADRRIRAQILIEEDADGHWCCERMSPIGRNDIFPYEWRIEAYRCFLPDEVPAMLDKWQTYLEAVRAGHYFGYLSDWYLYRESRRALEFWRVMRETVQDLVDSGAQGSQILWPDVLDHIFNLPRPEPLPAPVFHEDRREQAIDVSYERLSRQLTATFDTLHHARHLWNRSIKNKRFKFHGDNPCFSNRPLNFQAFVSGAHDTRIDDLFAWLDACVKDQMGLYLWV